MFRGRLGGRLELGGGEVGGGGEGGRERGGACCGHGCGLWVIVRKVRFRLSVHCCLCGEYIFLLGVYARHRFKLVIESVRRWCHRSCLTGLDGALCCVRWIVVLWVLCVL